MIRPTHAEFLTAVAALNARYGAPPAAFHHPTPGGGWWWVGWRYPPEYGPGEHRMADRMPEACARFLVAQLVGC
ncbi:hypothetical protein J0H58_21675 [bacterium]|nr:hypothetical protein [bacterium]